MKKVLDGKFLERLGINSSIKFDSIDDLASQNRTKNNYEGIETIINLNEKVVEKPTSYLDDLILYSWKYDNHWDNPEYQLVLLDPKNNNSKVLRNDVEIVDAKEYLDEIVYCTRFKERSNTSTKFEIKELNQNFIKNSEFDKIYGKGKGKLYNLILGEDELFACGRFGEEYLKKGRCVPLLYRNGFPCGVFYGIKQILDGHKENNELFFTTGQDLYQKLNAYVTKHILHDSGGIFAIDKYKNDVIMGVGPAFRESFKQYNELRKYNLINGENKSITRENGKVRTIEVKDDVVLYGGTFSKNNSDGPALTILNLETGKYNVVDIRTKGCYNSATFVSRRNYIHLFD